MAFIFNVLAISGAAMFAGVMLAIGKILGKHWSNQSPKDFLSSFSQHAPFIMKTVKIVFLPTVIGLLGSIWQTWDNTICRVLWLYSAGCIAVIMIMTMTYFTASNSAFMSKSIPQAMISEKLKTWLTVHNIRIVLAVISSALGILAKTITN